MMNSWKTVPLIALADYINGYAFKPEDHTDEGLPIIRIEQLKDDSAELDHYDKNVPEYNLIHNGDLIFSWSASLFLRIWDRGDAILNQHLFKVIPFPDIDKQYLKYCIEYNLPKLSNSSHGSTMKHITRKELKRFHVSLPSEKKEQAKIAEVLYTIDRAIAQTEALIAKHQRIKTGLMQDLLTRGIDEHGQLRDPSTHRFKSTPLGMIPEEWETGNLYDLTDMQVGFAFKSKDFQDDNGVLLLRGENVGNGKPDWSNPKYLSHELAQNFEDYQLQEGDIIIGMDRTFTKQGCKISFIEKNDLPSLLVQRVGRFVPKSPVGFLRALFSSKEFQSNLQKQEKGMDIPHLSRDEILGTPVRIPSREEMEKIAKVTLSAEVKIIDNKVLLEKLKSIKTGLMQDLLSGRVSVKVLMEG
jgi:type I restriction enzyme S subunit